MFSINEAFASKSIKVRIGTVVAQKENEQELQQTQREIDSHRHLHIDAALVRVMKARRRLDHNTLISEVTRQLQPFFEPRLPMIKQRIEHNIDQDFIKRDDVDNKVYHYIA